MKHPWITKYAVNLSYINEGKTPKLYLYHLYSCLNSYLGDDSFMFDYLPERHIKTRHNEFWILYYDLMDKRIEEESIPSLLVVKRILPYI